jgi:hypothetical protein
MQEQKRMRELQEKEEQKALFTEKIARQMYEAEVCVSYCYIIIHFCVQLKSLLGFLKVRKKLLNLSALE